MWLLFALAVGVGVFFWLMRQRELFCLSVRDGRLLLVRGRLPPSLFEAYEDALSKPPVRRGTVTVHRSPHGARVSVSGDIDDWHEQRLRNLLGLYPLSKLDAAPAVTNRTPGQVLGFAWLAWLFERR